MNASNVLACPDCGNAMEAGFMPEVTHHAGVVGMTCWHPGLPEEQKWFGFIKTGGVQVDWKSVIGVTTFRCTGCGVLKHYAFKTPPATDV